MKIIFTVCFMFYLVSLMLMGNDKLLSGGVGLVCR